jgi:rare lipoprotein A
MIFVFLRNISETIPSLIRNGIAISFIFCLHSFAQDNFPQIGISSYYGKEFHGKTTSNGEKFNMYSMTAAHQTLPYNTIVRVTNLVNHKSVIVRINDAGPFKDNRIIDLSKVAAIKLDMLKHGTAKVKIEVMKQDTTTNDFYSLDINKIDLSGYAIQIGSYLKYDRAVAQFHALKKKKIPNIFLQTGTKKNIKTYRVVVTGFSNRDKAEKYLDHLRANGKNGFVFQIR